MAEDGELEQIKDAVRALHHLHVQNVGRIAALEVIAAKAVYDRAMLSDNPFEFAQGYIRAMRQDVAGAIPSEGREAEEKAFHSALEDFLEQILMKAGVLPGAPSSPLS